MQAPNNDRWERRKRYLLRNMLVNPGFELSPIPEEERSSPDSSDSGSLPDLIVERAPDRHDDPPEFYEGLERRMKQYYRELFLGAHGSDDEISSDFEVNRSMASTFELNINTRKDNEKGGSTRETQIISSINSDDSYDESGTHDDNLIDTCATYNETCHISIDDSNKSSSTGAHSETYETDVDENVNENDQDNTNQPKASDEDRLQLNDDCRRLTVDEIEEIIVDKSVSEDSHDSQDCRILTTIAQIHEPRPERPQMVDDGSPVLRPSLIRFGRPVLGTNSVGRYSGQRFNVLLGSDEITTTLPPQKSVALNELNNTGDTDNDMERLLTASELTNARLDVDKTEHNESSDDESFDFEPIAQSSKKSFEDIEPLEMMREAMETRGNVSWHEEETSQASPMLAFEAPTSAKQLQDISTDSTEMNASLEDTEAEFSEDSRDDHNIGRISEDINNESSYDHSTGRITEDIDDKSNDISTPVHNSDNIIEEFRSVSPIDVNREDDNMNTSNINKRKLALTDENPPVKKKKEAAVPTSVEERKKWSDLKSNFFVGTPLVFRLCQCQDHECS